MKTVHTIAELREEVRKQKAAGNKVGFVPTMGNLHEGHISLVEKANEVSDFVIASIFVNPLQFGAGEDLDTYPRTLPEDQQKLEAADTDLLFAPSVTEMYPNGNAAQTTVTVPDELTDTLCGASRPGHFCGVTTVVTKLFGMVQPDLAVFGEKDYQQLAVIRRMTNDLCLPVEIIGMPTVREDDGLAKSSRNGFLTDEQRSKAVFINQLLKETIARIESGDKAFKDMEQLAIERLKQDGFEPDYFAIRQQDTLKDATAKDNKIVVLVAAKLGTPRLIDNMCCELI
ncbi:MAG: pantoate--beta-alanine ligase [Gammaproteobacteria bacterium]|nr:MAG: pantoate--beta-alanine ligase [Gammaproteobacteria bacterium]